MVKNRKFVAASLIPTGIRCSIGGYIGDATPVTNALAGVCDFLITNPNAVNAGAFNFKKENVLYVEGFAIDQLFENKISLAAPKKNTIGIILERSKDPIAHRYFYKAIEGYQSAGGVRIADVVTIPELAKTIRFVNDQFCADIGDIRPLLDAASSLKKKGVDAIAVATHIPLSESDLRSYQRSEVANPYGLLEALISHCVIERTGLPAAHGPLLTKKEIDFYLYRSFKADPRAACENISGAYIGSVLLGLDQAPAFLPPSVGEISRDDIRALIVPSFCLRGIPVAMADACSIPIIEVMENRNIFHDSPFKIKNTRRVKTYQEAIGVLNRMKEAIH